jgi:hypothetical protein
MTTTATHTAERRFELDLAKALAVVFMIFVHARMLFGDHATPSWPALAVDFAGTPLCAPVFMICMGAGWVLARHTSAGAFLRRGLALLALGYLLNVLRLSIPLAVVGPFPGGFSVLTPLNSFFAVDILQFAGMAFLFIALMRRWRVADPAILGITLVLSAVGGVLNGRLLTGLEPVAALQGLLVFAGLTTAFPLLSWLPYPVAGYLFAKRLLASENKDRFYGELALWSGVTGTTVFLTGSYYGLTFDSYFGYSDYYAQTPLTTAGILALAFGWMSLLYGLTRLWTWALFRRTVSRWSCHVLIIYLAQWIILDWSAIVLHRLGVSIPATDRATGTIALAVLVLADAVAVGVHHIQKRFAHAENRDD